MSERTFTYRCVDSSKNLKIGIQLQPENEKKFKASKLEVAWQQKMFSLWEIAKYSCYCDEHDQGHGDHPKEYISRFRTSEYDIRNKCLKQLKDYGCYVYTYIDADGWVPHQDKIPRSSSTAAPSPIAECMASLPDSSTPLSDPAHSVHQTLARESNFRIMYVVAVTVQDIEFVKRCFFIPKTTSMMEFVQGGVTALNEPWRKLRNPEHIKEHVLCTIRIYQGGSQEVTPGFSEEEDDSDEESGPFKSMRALRVAKMRGHRLTTFRVTGFNSLVYSLENLTSETLQTVEETLLNESVRTADSSANSFMSSSNDTHPIVRMRCELVSAIDFDADSLYCEYQIVAPSGCHCPDADWLKTEQGEEFLPGATQVASCAMIESADTHDPTVSFTLNNPATTFFIVLWVLLVGYFLKAEESAWIWGSLLVTLSALLNTDHRTEYKSTAHFGVPINFTLLFPNPHAPGPLILFQICSVDWLGRHRIEGYGFHKLDAKGGSTDCEVSTWLPVSSPWSQLEDYFVGGGNRLKDLRFIATPPRNDTDTSHKQRFMSKFGFSTQSSGSGRKVRVRTHAVEQHPVSPLDEDLIANQPPRTRHINREGVDLPVASLGALEGDTTAEKASAYIRQLQERRSRLFEEFSDTVHP
mmetsp:Transcript_48886/g.62756  ORF Transcript_48886/g.62756 Transcript_48886/m.62756 type:complete len:638 (+) Transcript_48886:102-2015(+)